MKSTLKVARLLRTSESVISNLERKMSKVTGRNDVIDDIAQDNKSLIDQRLKDMGLNQQANSSSIFIALLKKVRELDTKLTEMLSTSNYGQIDKDKFINRIHEASSAHEGWFLKEEKMKDFLILNPPAKIIKALGYKDVFELIKKENIYEIAAALRFVEGGHWINEFFLKPYYDLQPSDFELRKIKLLFLSDKWSNLAHQFIGKKLHNISHLKEMGVVFFIPLKDKTPTGEVLESFSLFLHYSHEIDFYSKIFRQLAKGDDFGSRLISLISGQVTNDKLNGEDKGMEWRIIQRYLAKLDPSDPRLGEPHINPEALHWAKAEDDLYNFSQRFDLGFDFWHGLDYVGDYFLAGQRGDELVSFDLIDVIISLTHGGISKYLYHQQEALWNEIFKRYLSETEMERVMMNNLEKGSIEIK
ncbi:MAG: hypothetical protein GWP10_07610 [Nitrospiraceae bacterium]|nr:hypothetical protein [Nitrospiraceae bacterium]